MDYNNNDNTDYGAYNPGNGLSDTGSYSSDPYEYSYVSPRVEYKFVDDPPKKKKTVGFTRGGIALLVIVCLLVGSLSGIGGALAVKGLGGSGSSDGTTVMYQSIRNESLSSSASGYTVAEIAAVVAESVVEIETEAVTFGYGWNQNYVTSGAGSGVILSADGYIITCAHVVDGASQINVTLTDGTVYAAELVGADIKTDIAVIKIDAGDLTCAVLGNSDKTVVGELAIAIGNPLGSLGGTVTDGIVSALDRQIEVEGVDMVLMQTNADVSPGNSGGGLFNSYGELIGIVNAKSADEDAEGIGFAIPINGAVEVAENLIENGSTQTERAAIGATVISVLTDEAMQEYDVSRRGVYIGKVNKNGASDKAGLEAGDYILSIDGNLVNELDDLTEYIASCKVGQKVTLQIIRTENDRERAYTIELTLEQYNASSYN